MEKGDVAWAGGSAGPDFFIMMNRNGFGASHTVWGSLADEESMALAQKLVRAGASREPLRPAASPCAPSPMPPHRTPSGRCTARSHRTCSQGRCGSSTSPCASRSTTPRWRARDDALPRHTAATFLRGRGATARQAAG